MSKGKKNIFQAKNPKLSLNQNPKVTAQHRGRQVQLRRHRGAALGWTGHLGPAGSRAARSRGRFRAGRAPLSSAQVPRVPAGAGSAAGLFGDSRGSRASALSAGVRMLRVRELGAPPLSGLCAGSAAGKGRKGGFPRPLQHPMR